MWKLTEKDRESYEKRMRENGIDPKDGVIQGKFERLKGASSDTLRNEIKKARRILNHGQN